MPDDEGFLQPKINDNLCVACGKCEQICPVLHPGEPREPVAVYAAKAKDDELRRISSSGGVFSLLARKILDEGGVVFGAAYEPPTFKVIHKAVFDEKGLDELRGSKYVQSEIGNTYKEAKQYLESGRQVLFSGCPCQIAGLKSFLGKDYANLLLVDVICHGVPSPKVWQIYVENVKEKFDGEILKVYSRREVVWGNYALSFDVAAKNGGSQRECETSTHYFNGFVMDIFNRKCCHSCSFRAFKSGADVTIGDYWGVVRYHPDIFDVNGVSAIILNTECGVNFFSEVTPNLNMVSSKLDSVVANNKVIFGNHKPHPKRFTFFQKIEFTEFDVLVSSLSTPPLWYRILRWIKWHTIGKPVTS
jgi:coenzyme F420-reducing hydrogenase beta subunit